MRKLISLFLVLVLSISAVCALAEEQADNFLISDWQYIISYEGQIMDEEVVFIYEDGTFEAMTDEETAKGTWTFDGETLVLTRGEGEEKMELSLKWDEGDHLFAGVFNGMDVVLSMNGDRRLGRRGRSRRHGRGDRPGRQGPGAADGRGLCPRCLSRLPGGRGHQPRHPVQGHDRRARRTAPLGHHVPV